MKTSTIRLIAHCLPTGCLAHEELVERFGADKVAAIVKMSGIRARRVVTGGQCASDLALAAAERLLIHGAVDRRSIDLLTFASQTPDYRVPATACVLHGKLGLTEACCTFDLNQACASFLHNLAVAHAMVVAGTVRRALILNADALSTLVHPRDRGLVTLHGDGAAAALVEAEDCARGGVEFVEFGTDGTKFDKLFVPAGGARLPSGPSTGVEIDDGTGSIRTLDHLYMDGPAIFHFCMHKITDVLRETLRRRALGVDDFDLVLVHQANRTMVELIYRSLRVPPAKQFYFLEEIGNSSGASLPSLLAQAWREGRVRPGSRTLLCAFGGGLSWGVMSIRWPDDAAAAVPGDVDVDVAGMIGAVA